MAKQISVELFMVIAIGFVLGLFGPFGTFAMPSAIRIAVWIAFIVTGYLIFRPTLIVGKWMSAAFGVSQIIGNGLGLAIAAAPMTLLVALFFSGGHFQQALQWDGLGLLYSEVWLIGFLINGFFTLGLRDAKSPVQLAALGETVALSRRGSNVEPVSPHILESEPPPLREAHFKDRLPAGFGTLIALKGEDHYVRALSETRDVLILIRLRDAITELGEAPGFQVHRSWWVAREGIASVKREGRGATITLANGTEITVARERVAVLKEAGLLKR
jgi:LytTr DNA-binding domain